VANNEQKRATTSKRMRGRKRFKGESLLNKDMMMDNRQLLNHLFQTKGIDLKHGVFLDKSAGPMPKDFDFGRVEGMMLGLAIGDSLGITTEGMLPGDRKRAYGEIRKYLPNRYVNLAKGFPSDDTQLAFWTLEQMISDKGFNPENVASRFCQERIFGIGATVRTFIYNHRSGLPWYKCGPKSAGNGSLMRIAPVVIPHLRTGTPNLWADTALSAMIIHNDSGAIAACLSFISMIWELFKMDEPPRPEWWLETFVDCAKELEIGEYQPRGGAFPDYVGPIWKFVRDKVGTAYRQGLSVLDACNLWYSGAFLLETVPSVIFILMSHGERFEEAILRAVNDTKDNDTIAAVVGAAVGALHGKEDIPTRWLSNLSGRTSANDDGRVFELIEKAKRRWWE
jgi:ADP-ribosyl-[dinitrogen reductase] hydrolase